MLKNQVSQGLFTAFNENNFSTQSCFLHLSTHPVPKYRYKVCLVLIEQGKGWNSYVCLSTKELMRSFLRKEILEKLLECVLLYGKFQEHRHNRKSLMFLTCLGSKNNKKLPLSSLKGVSRKSFPVIPSEDSHRASSKIFWCQTFIEEKKSNEKNKKYFFTDHPANSFIT